MIILSGGLIGGIIGVCLGNTLWLVGLIAVGIGIWGYKVNKESIVKVVSMMSMMTGGKTEGFALKLKGLVDPEDRTDELGKRMLIVGAILLIIGCAFVASCAG